jgi:hypothetical protein
VKRVNCGTCHPSPAMRSYFKRKRAAENLPETQALYGSEWLLQLVDDHARAIDRTGDRVGGLAFRLRSMELFPPIARSVVDMAMRVLGIPKGF